MIVMNAAKDLGPRFILNGSDLGSGEGSFT